MTGAKDDSTSLFTHIPSERKNRGKIWKDSLRENPSEAMFLYRKNSDQEQDRTKEKIRGRHIQLLFNYERRKKK